MIVSNEYRLICWHNCIEHNNRLIFDVWLIYKVAWWKRKSDKLPKWANECKKAQPSSAAAKRVFSLHIVKFFY